MALTHGQAVDLEFGLGEWATRYYTEVVKKRVKLPGPDDSFVRVGVIPALSDAIDGLTVEVCLLLIHRLENSYEEQEWS